MITLNHIQKQFGSNVLFRDCSLQIGVRDRVGLIGPNGAGKTSLFRMILGEESIDEGEILIAKGVKTGWRTNSGGPLQSTHLLHDPGHLEAALEWHSALLYRKEEIRCCSARMNAQATGLI